MHSCLVMVPQRLPRKRSLALMGAWYSSPIEFLRLDIRVCGYSVVLWKLRNKRIVECETIWELDEMFKFLVKLSLVSTILLQSLTPVRPMQGYLMQLVSHNQFFALAN